MSQNDGFSGFGLGQIMLVFLGGAAAGAVVAYLTAPRSGQRTRAELRGRLDEVRDTAGHLPDAFREAADAAREAFEEALTKQHHRHA